MSTPISAQYNAGMQEFTNLSYSNSEQHRELTSARMSMDLLDLQKISSKLIGCSLFSPEPSLRNIVNGVVAHELVSVHKYEEVARVIMHNMIGKPVFTFTFRRKDKPSAVRIAADRTIDSGLRNLFERFLVVAKTGELLLEEVMSYELSPFPPALDR